MDNFYFLGYINRNELIASVFAGNQYGIILEKIVRARINLNCELKVFII